MSWYFDAAPNPLLDELEKDKAIETNERIERIIENKAVLTRLEKDLAEIQHQIEVQRGRITLDSHQLDEVDKRFLQDRIELQKDRKQLRIMPASDKSWQKTQRVLFWWLRLVLVVGGLLGYAFSCFVFWLFG